MSDAMRSEERREGKPLAGRRILVTRAREQASRLAEALEALGATVIQVPTIEIAPLESFAALDGCIGRLGGFDWLVLSSANGARVFAERAAAFGIDPAFGTSRLQVAAVGPSTAEAAEAAGWKVALVPTRYVAEGLAEALLAAPGSVQGKRVLIVGAEVVREVLPQALREAGALVEVAEAYRTISPRQSIDALRSLFAVGAEPPEAITFTSSSTATNLFALMEAAGCSLPQGIALASIGPITSQTLRELGREPDMEAAEATVEGLAHALEKHFGGLGR